MSCSLSSFFFLAQFSFQRVGDCGSGLRLLWWVLQYMYCGGAEEIKFGIRPGKLSVVFGANGARVEPWAQAGAKQEVEDGGLGATLLSGVWF
jgi:hypothetical protein